MYAADETRIVLVAGASQGVGAAVARKLAAPGTHVMTADVFDEVDAVTTIDTVAQRFGRLDTLVLHASAMGLNRDGHRRLAKLAMSLMPVGGHIVYVTSHQAHFYPHKAVPKGYAEVAASMRAGETALYNLRSEFDRAGIRFTVVSGEADGGFAPAIVAAATSANPSRMVYVGSADYLMTA
jgi:3-oxoacyl-[acyl-carrier protein] reductase